MLDYADLHHYVRPVSVNKVKDDPCNEPGVTQIHKISRDSCCTLRVACVPVKYGVEQ